jgi:hypothetical protein
MKGEQTLYNNLVPSSLTEIAGGKKSRRNSYLEKRNDAMATRYYYHSTICRLRYDDCLLALSTEFFLEPDTIIGRLKQRISYVNLMVKKRVTSAELRRLYPYFDWTARVNVKPLPLAPKGGIKTLTLF